MPQAAFSRFNARVISLVLNRDTAMCHMAAATWAGEGRSGSSVAPAGRRSIEAGVRVRRAIARYPRLSHRPPGVRQKLAPRHDQTFNVCLA